MEEIVAAQEALMTRLVGRDEAVLPRGLRREAEGIAEDFEAYLKAEPDALEARILYGKFLRSMGEDAAAARQFLEVERRDPAIAVVKQQLGNHFAETGQPMEALAFFIQARQLAPEEPLYAYQLGELLIFYREAFIDNGFYDRATLDREMLAAFAEAARLAPENLDFQVRHAEAFYDLAQPDWSGALAVWQAIAPRVADDPFQRQVVALHLARAHAELGQHDAARQQLAQVTEPRLAASKAEVVALLPES
ncbi:MAG: hypothetical protein ACOCVG_00425 [Verrucomicrobiota bacterium]